MNQITKPPDTKPQPCPKIALNGQRKPRKRAPGGGRKPIKAGRVRIGLHESVDSLAVAEIYRRASLEGQTVGDYLSDLFEPCADAAPVASDLA